MGVYKQDDKYVVDTLITYVQIDRDIDKLIEELTKHKEIHNAQYNELYLSANAYDGIELELWGTRDATPKEIEEHNKQNAYWITQKLQKDKELYEKLKRQFENENNPS